MKTKLLITLMATCLCVGAVACGGGENPEDDKDYQFSLSLASGKSEIFVGDVDTLNVLEFGGADIERTFTYETSDSAIASISSAGEVKALSAGTVLFTVTEKNSNFTDDIEINVNPKSDQANGGYNYSSASGKEAITRRTDILGKLEKYAMDSNLTGITLFENGGYVKYNERIDLPTKKYITGYGFGILTEGKAPTIPFDWEQTEDYKYYYHSASAEDPATINAYNASGSQVGDLFGYISSSYWSTKMNSTKDGYDWYPCLAADTVNGKANSRPIPNEPVTSLKLYRKWKIYVKTGADGLAYRTSEKSVHKDKYDGRNVELEDYEFIYKFLLAGCSAMSRGAEMAGDMTYGIKGAKTFYNRTLKLTTTDAVDDVWDSMKASGDLGIQTGTDEGGSYIALELLNPIDDFTAMYTLSSNLVTPMPREFLEDISGDGAQSIYISGGTTYGSFKGDGVLSNVLCCGPYFLREWNLKQRIVFQRNDNWFEIKKGRYNIKGIIDTIYEEAAGNTETLYNEFNAGKLDAVGIPTTHIKDEKGKPNVYETKGDSTFKLNVNSCTQDFWNTLNTRKNGWGNSTTYKCKPWMSNDDFLKGLFFSINRKEFALERGVQPSINYFSDSYLSDPENGKSYNETAQHKEAISKYSTSDAEGNNTFGYSFDKATKHFRAAVNSLVRSGDIQRGTSTNPTEINIHIRWMYQSDIAEYGDAIKSYFESAFNDQSVSNGTVKLVVQQDAVTQWEQVYSQYLQVGNFDLGFGAISGNTYNPLNFMEVLKSDNSSGFTLNWGTDTSAVDEKHPLIYDGKLWSFDALWQVADHGGIVEKGSPVKSVKTCYMERPKDLEGKETYDLRNGCEIYIPIEFVNVPNVNLKVESVQIYLVGSRNMDLPFEMKNGKIYIKISKETAQAINTELIEINKLDQGTEKDDKPFIVSKYGIYWTIEVNYSLSIAGDTPSQTYITVSKDKDTPLE